MQVPLEISIDLMAEELLGPSTPAGLVEVYDICEVDPQLRSGAAAANSGLAAELQSPSDECDDSVEIELTAEEIDAMLGGGDANSW